METLRSSPHFKRYSAPSVQSLTGADSIKSGEPCRALRATGAGSITVKRASDATSIVLDCVDGELHLVAATEIVSVSGVTAVTVYW